MRSRRSGSRRTPDRLPPPRYRGGFCPPGRCLGSPFRADGSRLRCGRGAGFGQGGDRPAAVCLI
ncbi:hypothetical protein, partial [Mesorhizobium sp.]|uniref:hypothetical protein n=1 Tax=Mesorhizobium sp. TaxID=1871066 RepID=UPI00345902E4